MKRKILEENRSKAEARTSYNQMSRWYDLLAGSTERKYRDSGLEFLDPQPGEHILEIGYGTGHCLLALARAVGYGGRVYGIDLSDGMHSIAQKRLCQAGLESRVELQIGDAAQLFFPPASVDAIFVSFTLELFDTPEIPIVLEKCYSMLRTGGRICVVCMVKQAHDNLMVRIYEWFHQVMPRIVDCRPIYARADLEKAGFQVEQVKSMSMWGLPVEIILAYR